MIAWITANMVRGRPRGTCDECIYRTPRAPAAILLFGGGTCGIGPCSVSQYALAAHAIARWLHARTIRTYTILVDTDTDGLMLIELCRSLQ
jgi:hypothetical protein